MPTPCCVAPFGGMAVPGTPSLMVRNRSASEMPCVFSVRVRSGPRPPPRAPSPWQNAQLARNSNSPSFAALGSFASGFLSCARARITPTTSSRAACTAIPPTKRRRIPETPTLMLPPCTAAHRNFARTIPLPCVNRAGCLQVLGRESRGALLHAPIMEFAPHSHYDRAWYGHQNAPLLPRHQSLPPLALQYRTDHFEPP